ncbi:50S ribosomal protein L11 methyltransferase, partial [Staphylococcus epidermidis]|nr:50S ribosomal protein L11 methyltransferase [Staphylococcus epidermidis]
MNWMELSIVVNHEVEYDVTEILESYGSNGVVIEDSNILEEQPIDKFGEIYDLNPEDYPEKGVRLKAYFNEFTYNENLKSNINYEILSLQQIDKTIYDYQEKLIAEVDWENEWKNYFHPF